MLLWDYVAKHTFDSPQNQIKLLLSEVKKRLKKKNLKILDAGGGLEDRGSLIDYLGKRIVIDIKSGSNVDVVGDIHQLPFPDQSFDLITLFMVMEHLYEPQLAIRECQRVLKPGGIIVGTTVQYWHTHSHPSDYYRYTRFGLGHIFASANLPLQKIWSTGGSFLILYHVIELNLPSFFRKLFLLTCPLFNFLDYLVYHHEDKRPLSDSLGWSFLAQKKLLPDKLPYNAKTIR